MRIYPMLALLTLAIGSAGCPDRDQDKSRHGHQPDSERVLGDNPGGGEANADNSGNPRNNVLGNDAGTAGGDSASNKQAGDR